VNLDRVTTIRRKENLITGIDLEGDVLTLLVESTLTDGNNDTFVQGFLGLLGDEDTRGSLLETREIRGGLFKCNIYKSLPVGA
jgi:hypothetical protein